MRAEAMARRRVKFDKNCPYCAAGLSEWSRTPAYSRDPVIVVWQCGTRALYTDTIQKLGGEEDDHE